ncbi:MAG: hypothetical protein RR128_08845 [Clostridium sp.]
MFGEGIITEVNSNKICIQFPGEVGIKTFLYPEAFEKYLKATNEAVMEDVLEELRVKQEIIEFEREVKERKEAEIKERMVKAEPVKKKAVRKTVKKKPIIEEV